MKICFVIGLGRSGTNLLGNILNSHPEIYCDPEAQPQFSVAVNTVVHNRPIAPLMSIYRSQRHALSEDKWYATKDHTNIWLVEKLRPLKPKFICIERPVLPVVSSSLEHEGVKSWVRGDFPPNPLSANYIDGYVFSN